MKGLKNENGAADFATMIIMAILALLGLSMLEHSEEEDVKEAIESYYTENAVEEIEKSYAEEENWNRKVIFANGEVKYITVECKKEENEERQCQIEESKMASK